MGFRSDEELAAFGVLLKGHLQQREVTVTELAAELGISPGAVSKYIGGQLRPKLEFIEGVEQFLKLSSKDSDALRRVAPRRRTHSASSSVREASGAVNYRQSSSRLRPSVSNPYQRDVLMRLEKQVILNLLWRIRSDVSYYEKVAEAQRQYYSEVTEVFFVALDSWDAGYDALEGGKRFQLVYEWQLLETLSRHIGRTPEADIMIARNRQRLAEYLGAD
jgi:predicted transcriptional regulator